MKAALALLALALAAVPACAARLRAGVARVEITPASPMTMYGYANRRCGPSNGTHDPLMAKALVLDADGSRIAIVTMDLGSIVSPALKKRVADELGIQVLLLSASHTHSAPAFLPYGSSPASDAAAESYRANMEGKVFTAIEQASKTMFDARLGVASGSLQLGYNRLLLRDDGRARALFDNPERIPYGPVDPEYMLLRIDDTAGTARALLVHYATHAVVLGPSSCKYSGDYPGVMQRTAEQELRGAQVMFVQGGAGDINPLFLGRSGNEEADFEVSRKMGELLAAEVLRANRRVQPVAAEAIRAKGEVIALADRWDSSKTIEAGITTVYIAPHIALAAVPGEAMHKLQTLWKSQAGVPHALFYGYTYSSGGTWAGYIPDLRTAAYGGYGADASTNVEVGAGENLIMRHVRNLYELRGMWRTTPGRN